MIIFKNLRYKNFLASGNTFIEINLDQSPTTIVVGANGTGKSSVFEAICFVLFNKSIRNINVPQLVNNLTQKNLLVEIEFSIGKDTYIVSRGMRPNIFEIYKNGKLVNQESEKKDYQEYLENHILKMNFKAFKQIVLSTNTDFKSFFALPSHARREIVEQLLDLQIFSVMNSVLKDKVSSNKQAILDIEQNISITNNNINLISKHLIEIELNNQSLINEKQSQIEKILLENDVFRKEAEELDKANNYKELQQSRENISRKHTKLISALTSCEKKITNILEEIKFYQNNDECPTCKQSIQEKFKDSWILKKKETQSKTVELSQEIRAKKDQYDLELSQFDSKIDIARSNNSKQIQLNARISANLNWISTLQSEIRKIEKAAKKTVNSDIQEHRGLLEKLTQEKLHFLEEKELLNVSSLLLKDTGIKSQIIKQYVPSINSCLAKYLNHMQFDTIFGIDENFDEKIASRYKDNFSYDSFSEGQKMRIDLALMLTWRDISKKRNAVSTNLLLLDETFDSSLDEEGTEDVLSILKLLLDDVNIIMISHRSNLVEKFSRVLTFSLDNSGFSKLT